MLISTDNGTIRNEYGDLEALRLIHEAGFDGIDYTFYGIDPSNDILNLRDKERYALAMQLREYAEKVGLTFPQAHAPLAMKYDEDYESKNYQDILRSLEFSYWLGIKQIVIHTLRYPREDLSIDSDAENRVFMRSFLPYAEKYDLDIGVENLFTHDLKRQCFFGRHDTPKWINTFMDSLESPRFKACCDLGHCAITGTEPESFISGMDPKRLTMLHVQDTDYKHDSHILPYMGKQNWDKITDAIAQIDFKGYMNLEVLHFYEMFPRELLPQALLLAAGVARRLANEVEAKKEVLKK